eukprot:557176-Pelagomonas_calceolata.AAC.3
MAIQLVHSDGLPLASRHAPHVSLAQLDSITGSEGQAQNLGLGRLAPPCSRLPGGLCWPSKELSQCRSATLFADSTQPVLPRC